MQYSCPSQNDEIGGRPLCRREFTLPNNTVSSYGKWDRFVVSGELTSARFIRMHTVTKRMSTRHTDVRQCVLAESTDSVLGSLPRDN